MSAVAELRARLAATVVDAYRDWRYERRHGFPPPPRWATLQSYEHILGTIESERLWALRGDFAEIGVFLAAGSFAHIHGNHEPNYVRGDFKLVWRRALPGAVVAFDDYGEDLPGVPDAVDALRRAHSAEIDAFRTDGPKTAFLRRRAA
ncbi:MAG: hypothetical protein ICV69_15950 [Thermoleophilaceae bacterium]|nr:hypothetical protein [Thermoleophilaceae bacterium]